MALPRFSIASLLGMVLFVGVGIAAFREPTDTWDSSLFGLTLLALLTAVLLAVHRTDRRRAYWLGFALFGWAYLVASLVPEIETRLPTTTGLAYLEARVHRARDLYELLVTGSASTSKHFMRIGHWLTVLVLAFVGGHVSRYLYGGSQHAQSRDSSVPSRAGIA